MKLLDIELVNFRTYGGTQSAEFSTSADRNVTTFYGTNGGGKTTLLNACLWGLYGKTSPDFEDAEVLINSEAWSTATEGAEVEACVALRFEHRGRIYRATRRRQVSKQGQEQGTGKDQFDLFMEDGSGAWKKVPNASSTIDKALPSQLRDFFFINGERIERLAKQEAYAEIQSAIKTVLGIEPLVRATRHLPAAIKRMRHKLKSEGGAGSDIEQVNAKIDSLESRKKDLQEERGELKTNIGHLNDEIASIESRLRTLDGTAAIQKDRDRAVRDRDEAEAQLDSDVKAQNALVRQKGYLTLLPEMPAQVTAACASLHERGDLPAPLKRTFVKDLLDAAECICGTHLGNGSPERGRIESWMQRAGLAEVESAWAHLEGAQPGIEDRYKTTITELAALDSSIATNRQKLRELNAKLDELSAKLKDAPGEDPAKLESRRDELTLAVGDGNRKLGGVEAKISQLTSELRQKIEELDTLEMKDKSNQLVLRRIRVLQDAEEALRRSLDLLSERTRRSLDARIKKVFEEASFKDYVPELTSDFVLELWVGSGDERRRPPKSTGENMLLALAFVAALAEECRSVAQYDELAMSDMSDFPVVLDAAFGNLDADYRRRVATFLPDMTSQVVVLTHKAQIEGAAEDHLAPRVGREYVITTHSRKKVQDITGEITVGGREYAYQVDEAEFDGAQLTEVEQ